MRKSLPLLLFSFAVALVTGCSTPDMSTPKGHAAVEQLTREYATWSICKRPIEFRNRLDVDSHDEQRLLLIQLAELGWNNFWGDFWRKCGVPDLDSLRALSPAEFLNLYHSSNPDNNRRDGENGFSAAKVAIDIHTISEARGMAYVVFSYTHDGRGKPIRDGTFQVLRAINKNGEWRVVAFPGYTNFLRAQLEHLKREQGIK
jgi:hypothetical protein